jgi:uncharacterized surface protein with fasciclin (FAS1) repeats
MRKYLAFATICLILISLFSCTKIEDQPKFQQPEWLAGKLYTQMLEEPELSLFARSLELTGYDSIVDVSGSYTIFAPTNDAFNTYFQEHSEYGNDVLNIPSEVLTKIVKSHIVQNAWSVEQLSMLDLDGWIDPSDPINNKPKAFKKRSILKEDNQKYWITLNQKQYTIVDSTVSSDYRKVFTNSRKYVPVFFQELFQAHSLETDDYEYYFNRPFVAGEIFYANAMVTDSSIFAENGFIYPIDRVIPPILNAEQLLKKGGESGNYNDFLNLIYQFPEFTFNLEETNNQPEAISGGEFDKLYDLKYPGLGFDINNELTGPNTNLAKYTIQYHNGLLAPTDEAFKAFIDEMLTANSGYPHWKTFASVPAEIKKIIVNTHMTAEPIYPSSLLNGIENYNGGIVKYNEAAVVQKYFGSNCTFIGLSEFVIPRAFLSITGPVYLRPGYSVFMYAMQQSKVLPALTNEDANYSFFPISDATFSLDSSLMFSFLDAEETIYSFSSFDRAADKMIWKVNTNDLARRIFNHVGISVPDGYPNKEFIRNLAGNYIIVNNITNTVSGAAGSMFGWNGIEPVDFHPVEFSETTDNGKTYEVGGWFLSTRGDMSSVLARYPSFLNLMIKAGIFDDQLYEFSFLAEGESYTVFAPSDLALSKYNTDTLSNDELIQFIKNHFVKGEHIFTDGKTPSGHYETLRIDESSTEFNKINATHNLRTGNDMIEILDDYDNLITRISEQEGKNNVMIITDTDEESESIMDYITSSILHEIDTVLLW